MATIAAITWFDALQLTPAITLGLVTLGAVSAMVLATAEAVRCGELSSRRIEPHISGADATIFLLAVVGLTTLAHWASKGAGPMGDGFGLLVLSAMALLFLSAALITQIDMNVPEALAMPTRYVGRLFSLCDSVASLVLARIAGATSTSAFVRFAAIAAIMVSSAILALKLPAPLSLLPVGWAFAVAIGLIRRWAWVEREREQVMLFPARTPVIGFDQDLRDEALVTIFFAFLLIPIGYQEMQSAADAAGVALFSASPPLPHLLEWYEFFGGELAKAIPMVDWSEVYGVGSATSISAETAASKHIVFVTRILFDVFLIGVLLQARAVADRNKDRVSLLAHGSVDRVDPFIERRLFLGLTHQRSGEIDVEAVARFPRYNADRLRVLLQDRDERVREAARWLLKRDGEPES